MITGSYWVYILASRRNGTLYICVTNNLRTRLEQHRIGHGSEFVRKYGVHQLVHVEEFASPQEAIAREKQLKNWRRTWKIQLIPERQSLLAGPVPPAPMPAPWVPAFAGTTAEANSGVMCLGIAAASRSRQAMEFGRRPGLEPGPTVRHRWCCVGV